MKVTRKINTISVKEFRRLGYLQELNRKFLHPLGMALSVKTDDYGEYFDVIWDERTDPEGIRYDDDMIDDEFIERAKYLEAEFARRAAVRYKKLGYVIQPLFVYIDGDEDGQD